MRAPKHSLFGFSEVNFYLVYTFGLWVYVLTNVLDFARQHQGVAENGSVGLAA
jgi:hypothetical protein